MIAAALYEYPALIAAAIVALGTIGKAAHWIYKFTRRVDERLGYIDGEMRFNGGSTQRDALGRIERKLDEHIAGHGQSPTVTHTTSETTTVTHQGDT